MDTDRFPLVSSKRGGDGLGITCSTFTNNTRQTRYDTKALYDRNEIFAKLHYTFLVLFHVASRLSRSTKFRLITLKLTEYSSVRIE